MASDRGRSPLPRVPLEPYVLGMDGETKHRPGRPPHDAVNGLRVGGLVGGVIAGLAVWLFDLTSIWVVVLGAVLGGTYGFLSERRKSRL